MAETTWTIAALKEHIERILAEKDKALSAALASQKEAVQVAEITADKWRAQANEWRATLTDWKDGTVQRSEFDIFKTTVETFMREEREYRNRTVGERKGLSDGWGWLVGAVGLIIAVVTFLGR